MDRFRRWKRALLAAAAAGWLAVYLPPVHAGPLRILYPETGSVIPNDRLVLMVEANPRYCDSYRPTLLVDGVRRRPPARPPAPFAPRFFFLQLPPGRHEIGVVYEGRSGGTACEDRVTVTLAPAGPLRFEPLDRDAYVDLARASDRTIAGLLPAAVGRRTALVRTQVRAGGGMHERFWLVPRDDERKAVRIIDGPPPLELDTGGHSSARGCAGEDDLYAVAAELAGEKQIGVYFLDASGRVEARKIGKDEILNRLFADGLAPRSWAARERDLKAWRSLSVLHPPDYYGRNRGRPLLCSNALAVVPLRVFCINAACKPSNLPVYLILRRGGGAYRLYTPDKARFDEENGWMGPDFVIPFADKVFSLDLEEATYRLLDEGRTYPLPLRSSLRAGQSTRFGGYVMEPSSADEGAAAIHLRYLDPGKPYDPKTRRPLDRRLAGTIGAVVLPDRLLLKQVFHWPGEGEPIQPGWPREYRSSELYYEIRYPAHE